MELKINLETKIEYFDKISLDLGWFKKISNFIYENLFNLDEDYYFIIKRRRERRRERYQHQHQRRLVDYPQFYPNGYIKFFTEKKELIYLFDNRNSKTVSNFMRDEMPPLILSTFFPEENEPTTLNIKLKLDLIEKI